MEKLSLFLLAATAVYAQPSIQSGSILNASGYQNKLAPDTVFVIFGSGMGPGSIVLGSAPDYATMLAGTSVSFTPAAGGAPVAARMVYAVAGQVAGLLPSSITPGAYAVRVTYNGAASAPQNVTVVARSFGIATVNSAGSGPAQATIGDVNNGLSLVRFTTGSVSFNGYDWKLTPSHGGDTLVFWGTGGGADAANDTGGTSGDQSKAGGFSVNLGGRTITPLYAGASAGYPGLWQLNFTIPADIAPDCYTPAAVTAGGETSNLVTIAIAAAGQTACTDPNLSAATLAKLDSGGEIIGGAFGLVHSDNVSGTVSTTQEFANGAIYRWTASQWATGAPLRPALGQCGVYDRIVTNGIDASVGPAGELDAGARLPLSGPNLTLGAAMVRSVTGGFGPYYQLNLTTTSYAAGGTYMLSGPGGAEVGPWAAVSTRMPDSFSLTNLSAIGPVDHTKALTLNWTGAGFDHLLIDVDSSVLLGAGRTRSVTITCDAPAAPGSFTIPAGLMNVLPASAIGAMGVYAQPNPGLFKADLTAGGQIDFGSVAAERGVSKSFAVQ
ncbi:MAG: hypothetical protein ABI972_22830 [Acidobacteriota bacterium]